MQHETDQIRSRTISQRLGQPQPDPSVESLSDRRRYQTKADLSHQLTTNQQALRSESDYRQQANRATSALRRDLNVERGTNDQLSAQNQALRIGALRRELLLRSLEEVRSAGLLRPRTVSPSLYLSPPPSSSLSSSSSASSDRRRHRSVSFSDSVLTYGERQEVMYRPRHHWSSSVSPHTVGRSKWMWDSEVTYLVFSPCLPMDGVHKHRYI